MTPHPSTDSESAALANRLRLVESAAVSSIVKGAQPRFWREAHGARVIDCDQREYIDLTSSFGVAFTGYQHPDVVGRVQSQATELTHSMIGIFPHEPYVTLLERLVRHVGRGPEPQVLLTTSGADAVEVALKLAVRHTRRPRILAFHGSFHGQTLGTLPITGQVTFRQPFEDILGSFVTLLPFPNALRPWCSVGGAEELCQRTLELVRSVVRNQDHDSAFAAIVVEPMQNAGGYLAPPRGFLTGLRAICDEHGILLICDEVFTGFGRCGEWLYADADQVQAEITCVGKAMSGSLPIAACLASRDVMTSMITPGLVPLHGSTFQGNALACAAASATIDVIENDHLIDRSRLLGEVIDEVLTPLADLPHVAQVRGVGLAWAIEYVSDMKSMAPAPEVALEVAGRLLSRGIITLVSGLPDCNVVAICPPAVIEEGDLREALGLVVHATAEVRP